MRPTHGHHEAMKAAWDPTLRRNWLSALYPTIVTMEKKNNNAKEKGGERESGRER